VLARVREARTALGSVAEVQPVYLPTGVKAEALRELAALEGQVAELKLRVLAASGDLAEEVAARDAGAWLAHTTRIDHRHARAELRLAEALDQHPVTATALAHGTLNLPQARVILTAVDKLPAEHRHRAEDHLIQLATQHGPADLRVLGERILEVVAPEVAEAALAEALEREERRAFQRQSVRIKPLGEGITRITALVPDAVADRLTTYLDAFTSPRKDDQTLVGEEDRIPLHRRRAHAFCALLEHLDPAKLPDHGGDATTLIVTVALTSLVKDLGVAGDLSAAEARRLACTARITPPCSAGRARSSTSAEPGGSTRAPSARPWRCATGTAAPRAAPSPRPGARPTTSSPGPRAAPPTSPTAPCSAASTTIAPTTPAPR
jgi:hypothetical protein